VIVEVKDHQIYWNGSKVSQHQVAGYFRQEEARGDDPDAIQIYRDNVSEAEATAVARMMRTAKLSSWRGCALAR